MSGSWSPDPTGRHQVRWWDGSAWTDHVSDDGATSTDPMVPPTPPPGPAVPPPPGGLPTPEPAAPAGGGRSKLPWIAAAVVLVVAGIGAYVVFAGGEDDDGSDGSDEAAPAAAEPDDTEPTTEPADGLAEGLGPVIEDAELGEDCPLLAEDTQSVIAGLGTVTSTSSGPDEVTLDEGSIPTAYCNVGTDLGLFSFSAAVTDLAAVDYLDEYFANRDPAHEGDLSGQGHDTSLPAAESGELAGTCLTDSPQYGEQCIYVWSDGTAVLVFADVGTNLGATESFAVLDRYVASALDRFGG